MAEHYPKSTVQVEAYCKKCQAMTPHRVHDGRVQSCLVCLEKLEPRASKFVAGPVQGRLF